MRAANKKAFENLALAGGFDSFTETKRSQYFHDEGDGVTFLEKAMRYGSKYQENENSSQVSLFGEASEVQIPEPVVPPCDDWSTMEKLSREKEVVGIYISGHPLDDFRYEMKYFCNVRLEALKNLEPYVNKSLTFAGIVTNVQYRTTKTGKDWGMFTLEGFDESFEFRMFDDEFLKFRHYLSNNRFVYFKVNVREGWINKETGKRSEPRIQFLEVRQLQDVLEAYAKKLTLMLDIKDIRNEFVHQLSHIFQANKGDHSVCFEVMETERIRRAVETATVVVNDDVLPENEVEVAEMEVAEVEETRIVTKLSMPSRKVKVKICSDLLHELERMDLHFKLN